MIEARKVRQGNGLVASADFGLERWRHVWYVKEMSKAGCFPLDSGVGFSEESPVPGSPQWT